MSNTDEVIPPAILDYPHQLRDPRPKSIIVFMSYAVHDNKCPACGGQLVSENQAYCDLCGWTFVMKQDALEVLLQEIEEARHETSAD
jgi:hypothetical protein